MMTAVVPLGLLVVVWLCRTRDNVLCAVAVRPREWEWSLVVVAASVLMRQRLTTQHQLVPLSSAAESSAHSDVQDCMKAAPSYGS